MNRSYSKIRHIQEANLLMEKRLLESRSDNLKPLISEQDVKQGAAGDQYQYKKEGGKYFYAKKAEGTNAKWVEQTTPKGIDAIATKIFGDPAPPKTQTSTKPVDPNIPTKENTPLTTPAPTKSPTNTNTPSPTPAPTKTPTNTNTTTNTNTNTTTNTTVPTNTNQPANTNQPQTTTEIKQGAPILDQKNINVGTEFVTWTRDKNRKETNKLCKVVQVEDIAIERAEYKMVKATDVNDGTNCGDVTFTNPTTGDKEGWLAFSKQSAYNYYQNGYIGNKTDKNPKGNWSWSADSGRQNEYSIFTKG